MKEMEESHKEVRKEKKERDLITKKNEEEVFSMYLKERLFLELKSS